MLTASLGGSPLNGPGPVCFPHSLLHFSYCWVTHKIIELLLPYIHFLKKICFVFNCVYLSVSLCGYLHRSEEGVSPGALVAGGYWVLSNAVARKTNVGSLEERPEPLPTSVSSHACPCSHIFILMSSLIISRIIVGTFKSSICFLY